MKRGMEEGAGALAAAVFARGGVAPARGLGTGCAVGLTDAASGGDGGALAMDPASVAGFGGAGKVAAASAAVATAGSPDAAGGLGAERSPRVNHRMPPTTARAAPTARAGRR